MGSIKTFFIIIFFLFFSAACSSIYPSFGIKDSKDAKSRPDKEIVKDFKFDKKVLQKFEEVPQIKEKHKAATTSKQMAKEKKKEVAPILPEKISPAKVLKKLTKKKYPKDYPEEFVSFNEKILNSLPIVQPKIFPGEEISMAIEFMGLTMGHIVFATMESTKIGNKEVYHLAARLKTASFYNFIYEVDNKLNSYVEQEKFLPVKYSYIQNESKQDVDDLQLFDAETLKTYSFYHRVTDKKDKKKQRERFTPVFFQDPFSLLYYIRSLPLAEGEKYLVPVVNKGETLRMSIEVEKREEIGTEIGDKQAIKVIIVIDSDGDSFKKGNLEFWLSDDERRILLKLKGKTKMGSLKGAISKYKAGRS